ncbi:MAG: hypothetical protein NTW96_04300 [Planctomycetia bacterium]|nr:hypothetical protein [Planctomycetia bacterium]
MSEYRKLQSVFVATVPPDWKRRRPWDVPPSIESATLEARHLSATEANHYVRVFNAAAMRAGLPDRRWAFVMHSTKPGCHGGRHQRRRELATA